jgi:anti-anti-sigma regulatory factor
MSDVIKREEVGEVVVLHITTPSVDAVSAVAIELACSEMRPITVIDFADVSFINSAGISALLKFVVSARRAGYQMSRFMPLIEAHDLPAFRR